VDVNPEVTLRPATPDDAQASAPLIREAGPLLFDRLFGPRPEDAIRFFEWLFARPDVPFSHEAALLAVRGGEVVGLALAMPAAARRRNSWRMLFLLPRRRGLWTLLRLAPVVHAFRNASAPPPPDCYYLSILAVRADERGRGIGGLLLEAMDRRAREAGCAAVCLHAELDNAGARRLYARHGYRVTAEHRTPRAARWGVAGFAALRKEVPSPSLRADPGATAPGPLGGEGG